MIKYAANAFLATKISFANEIANLCELVGADVRQVLPAIGADRRIGTEFLSAGVGWGGSCFGKDVAALIATGHDYGYSPNLLRASIEVNQLQRAAVIGKLQRELKILKGRRVALFGLSFKPGTDDLRDAPALDIARRLTAGGAVVSAYDPVVKQLPPDLAAVRIATDPYDAAHRANAVVLVTEWPEFRELDLRAAAESMRGSLLVDGRNFLDPDRTRAAGLVYEGVGRPSRNGEPIPAGVE
jgi:nucleotide sugar dehydrogenase